jgi:hypothetical protein
MSSQDSAKEIIRCDVRVDLLVAHHSCAAIEAEERGLAHVLTREFAPPARRRTAQPEYLTWLTVTRHPPLSA